MTEPNRWADAPASPAQKLVAVSAEVHPREVDVVEGWTRVLVATQKPRRDWRLVPAFFGSVALGALLMTLLRPAAPTGPRPDVVAAANARWELKNGEVVVGLGKVSIGAKAAVIATPHLRFQVVNGRVAADVTAERTTLLVEEGEVVMRSGARLAKGARLGWPPAPVIAPSLLTPPTAGTVCSDAADAQRAECLELEAQGDGLQAQAALYELGQLHAREQRPADALGAWQRSLARFPNGVLHPEARLAVLLELTRQQRFAEAEAAARLFEAECPGDPRIPDVARLRASLRPLP
jgi:hypothetical protein